MIDSMENKEFYIDCDGSKVHAKLDFPVFTEKAPEKLPLLIIIPGLTGHMEERHIIQVAEAAREIGFATLRTELYGHGKSEGKFEDHDVLIWMHQAMRVISEARRYPFVSDLYLSGHSQGGLTTVLAGGMMQDCIKALLPLSPAMIIPDAAQKGAMLGIEYRVEPMQERIPLKPGYTLSGNYFRAAGILPVEQCVNAFTKPVLIVHGTADEAVPYYYGEKLAGDYRNAKLVPILNDTHCYDYHLKECTEAVKEFLLAISKGE